jgi:flagellar export protein FliJ
MSGHDQRVRRLQRFAGLIQRKLDQEVAALARARQAHQESTQELQQAMQQWREGMQAGNAKLAAGAEADTWNAELAWQERLRNLVADAAARVEQRREDVTAARSRVLLAREDLSRMETLIQRLETTRRKEEVRLERRAEDDIYAAMGAPALRAEGR